MSPTLPPPAATTLRLHAATAADAMTANPMSIREELTVHEAVVFLIERGISAAPVINEAGRPVGVVTEADILRHNRDHADHMHPVPAEAFDRELTLTTGEHLDKNAFEVHPAEPVERPSVAPDLTPHLHANAQTSIASLKGIGAQTGKKRALKALNDDDAKGIVDALSGTNDFDSLLARIEQVLDR